MGAESFKDLYDKLEAPISERLAKGDRALRHENSWPRKWQRTGSAASCRLRNTSLT